mmetsp:Transcript_64064/g.139338  ORF Transcript_64064/g.139338 Transcript_64064/m.139338 type:complete len:750 (-) Transcript_64064:93-2342(-)
MPGRGTGTWRHGPLKAPTNKKSAEGIEGRWRRIEVEFSRCGGSADRPIIPEDLACYWCQMAEEERRLSGHCPLGQEDRQVIALRASQAFKEMDLLYRGHVDRNEWVHYMLLQQDVPPGVKVSPHINSPLKAALNHHPAALGDLLRIFEDADEGQGCRLSLADIEKMYTSKKWEACLSAARMDALQRDEFYRGDPESLAKTLLEAMDITGDGTISYAEFMVFLLGRRKKEVEVHLYDLTNGRASALAPWLIGQQLEGLWHTGLIVYNKEYHYGGDILVDTPGLTHFGRPTKTINMGYTVWRQEEFNHFVITQLGREFNKDRYDIVTCNCNHFTDSACLFLTGKNLSDEIVQQSQSLLDLPAGRMLRPLLNRWLGNLAPVSEPEVTVPDVGTEEPLPTLPSAEESWLRCGSVVAIRPVDSTGRSVLGQVCSSLANEQICKSKEATRGPTWVRYLDVPPVGDLNRRPMALRTECIPRGRLAARSQCFVGCVVYEAALRALSLPALPSTQMARGATGIFLNRSRQGVTQGWCMTEGMKTGFRARSDTPPPEWPSDCEEAGTTGESPSRQLPDVSLPDEPLEADLGTTGATPTRHRVRATPSEVCGGILARGLGVSSDRSASKKRAQARAEEPLHSSASDTEANAGFGEEASSVPSSADAGTGAGKGPGATTAGDTGGAGSAENVDSGSRSGESGSWRELLANVPVEGSLSMAEDTSGISHSGPKEKNLRLRLHRCHSKEAAASPVPSESIVSL